MGQEGFYYDGLEERGSEDLFCYDISLERRLCSNHPLRIIKEMIDFSFIYSEVVDKYGVNGNLSVPPPVILKLLLFRLFTLLGEHRPLCTGKNGLRTIKRLDRAEELEAMRLAARSEASRRDLKKRQHLMERSFATATRYGISRARWRGIRKMEIQELITSSIQNILKLISRSICPDGIPATAKNLQNRLEIPLFTTKKTILVMS